MSKETEVEELPVDADLVGKPCCYCGTPSEGHFAIYRDGFGEGPEVPLCDEHGGTDDPSASDIWARIVALREAS